MKVYYLKPRDIIALVVMVGGMILIAKGIDRLVGGLLVTVVAFYFGLNLPKPKEE